MAVIFAVGFSACKTGTPEADMQSSQMTETDIMNSSDENSTSSEIETHTDPSPSAETKSYDETGAIDTQQDAQKNPVKSLTKLPKVTQYSDRLDDALKVRRSMLTADEQRLYDQFLPYVLSFTSFTIDYKDMDYELKTLKEALKAIRLDYPETWLYFSDGSDLDMSLKDDNGYYGRFVSYSSTYFSLEWSEEGIERFDKKFVSDYIGKIDKKCDLILKQMPKGLSVKEKYIWLADYLCAITEYYQDPNGKYIYADGPLLNGKGICQSYAYAYQWLCQKAGLWCTTCSGMSGGVGHCWNIVKLEDQKTYYMDLTWADGVSNPHKFYFMSYDKCTQFHTIDQGEWIADGE